MNSDQYKAAAKGKIERFKNLARDHELGSTVTHKKNTVLHVNIIASQTQNKKGERVSIEFVERILEMCPSLLLQVNAKGDAPLHAAAKRGHAAVVEALIEFAKRQPNQELESGTEPTVRRMLGMKNDEENTALHEAVQSDSLGVVEILLKADPDFLYSGNGCGETPPYMAAARGYNAILAVILENCPSGAHGGPNGETALHAAARSGYGDTTRLLLAKKESLTKERDRYGCTPLHYTAYFGYPSVTEQLLKADKSVTLIPDEDQKMTALHLAAGKGNVLAVHKIIDHCPECCELVDERGWNVLHFAMVSFSAKELRRLLNKYSVVRNLIFEKDEKGNTPFHVLAAVSRRSYNIVSSNLANSCYKALNKQNISPKHINRYGSPDLEDEIQKLSKADGSGQYPDGIVRVNNNKELLYYPRWKDLDEGVIGIEKASKYHLVVATLIATVTFAGAFTLPGGYKGDTKTAQRGALQYLGETQLSKHLLYQMP